MQERAKAAMVKPFVVSLMADPSGAYTTAAAMVACVEAALQRQSVRELRGLHVLVLGGTGPVGRIAGVIAAQAGAKVVLSSRSGADAAEKVARETGARFGVELHGVSGSDREAVRASLADAQVVLACAAAGVQVLSADDLASAKQLEVAADINAVPPAGIAGVGVMDNAVALAGTKARGHRRAGRRQRQVPDAAAPAGADARGREAGVARLRRSVCDGARVHRRERQGT